MSERSRGWGEKAIEFSEKLDKATILAGAGLIMIGPAYPPAGILGVNMVFFSGLTLAGAQVLKKEKSS